MIGNLMETATIFWLAIAAALALTTTLVAVIGISIIRKRPRYKRLATTVNKGNEHPNVRIYWRIFPNGREVSAVFPRVMETAMRIYIVRELNGIIVDAKYTSDKVGV